MLMWLLCRSLPHQALSLRYLRREFFLLSCSLACLAQLVGSSLSAGAIAGATVGGMAALGVIILLAVVFFLKKKRKTEEEAKVFAVTPMEQYQYSNYSTTEPTGSSGVRSTSSPSGTSFVIGRPTPTASQWNGQQPFSRDPSMSSSGRGGSRGGRELSRYTHDTKRSEGSSGFYSSNERSTQGPTSSILSPVRRFSASSQAPSYHTNVG